MSNIEPLIEFGGKVGNGDIPIEKICTPGRIRTCDLLIRSPLLYPLSYGRTLVNYITLSHIYCKLADTVTFWPQIPELIEGAQTI